MNNILSTSKKYRSLKANSGVTLLEILIAVGILAFSISAIMQIFPMGFSSSARASYTAIAYELANKKMEEIRSTYIFGGDPDPSLACDNIEGYKYYGYRGTHLASTADWDLAGGHPLCKVYGDIFDYINPNRFDSAERGFYPFSSADGANVESRYYYRVELLPQVDVVRRSGNRVYVLPAWIPSGWLTHPDYKYLAYNVYSRHGFCDAYRVKVTVRGPVRKREHAEDENWKYYKKAAVEANLATIIANKEFGVGYLAYDVICRVGNKSSGQETMYRRNKQDSRCIYVTGPNYKRFYPENFAVIRPETLSMNERWDTGPAITFPCNKSARPATNKPDAYYASRSGGTNHKYNYYETWDLLTGSNTSEQITGHTINYSSVRDSLQGCAGNSSWNDVNWNSAQDHSVPKQVFKIDPQNIDALCAHSGTTSNDASYVPGGLNLLGQDNIMLICRRKGTDNKYYYYAESNKLIFMCPPHTDYNGVTPYGIAYEIFNNTNYWRFDLLNNVYGRDSDCNVRYTKYGSQPLVDEVWGMPNSGKGYAHDGDFDLLSFKEDGIDRTQRIDLPNTSSSSSNSTPYFVPSTSSYSAVYGYPKASFNSDGTLKSGTVVRFMMQMPTRE